MKFYGVTLASIFLFSLSVDASSLNDNNEYREKIIIESGVNPEKIADSIVILVPSENMDLHKPSSTERIIKGEIIKVEKGAEPKLIILNADTFISPLTKDVPKKIFLKKFPNRDAYYPIAIYPVPYKYKLAVEYDDIKEQVILHDVVVNNIHYQAVLQYQGGYFVLKSSSVTSRHFESPATFDGKANLLSVPSAWVFNTEYEASFKHLGSFVFESISITQKNEIN